MPQLESKSTGKIGLLVLFNLFFAIAFIFHLKENEKRSRRLESIEHQLNHALTHKNRIWARQLIDQLEILNRDPIFSKSVVFYNIYRQDHWKTKRKEYEKQLQSLPPKDKIHHHQP